MMMMMIPYVVTLGMAFRDIAEKEKVMVTNEEIQGDGDNSDDHVQDDDDDDDDVIDLSMYFNYTFILIEQLDALTVQSKQKGEPMPDIQRAR